jgi:hypothetical protein
MRKIFEITITTKKVAVRAGWWGIAEAIRRATRCAPQDLALKMCGCYLSVLILFDLFGYDGLSNNLSIPKGFERSRYAKDN